MAHELDDKLLLGKPSGGSRKQKRKGTKTPESGDSPSTSREHSPAASSSTSSIRTQKPVIVPDPSSSASSGSAPMSVIPPESAPGGGDGEQKPAESGNPAERPKPEAAQQFLEVRVPQSRFSFLPRFWRQKPEPLHVTALNLLKAQNSVKNDLSVASFITEYETLYKKSNKEYQQILADLCVHIAKAKLEPKNEHGEFLGKDFNHLMSLKEISDAFLKSPEYHSLLSIAAKLILGLAFFGSLGLLGYGIYAAATASVAAVNGPMVGGVVGSAASACCKYKFYKEPERLDFTAIAEPVTRIIPGFGQQSE